MRLIFVKYSNNLHKKSKLYNLKNKIGIDTTRLKKRTDNIEILYIINEHLLNSIASFCLSPTYLLPK